MPIVLWGRPYLTSDDFCPFLTPLSPSSDFLLVPLYLIRFDQTPHPPYHLTSYMDGPFGKCILLNIINLDQETVRLSKNKVQLLYKTKGQ